MTPRRAAWLAVGFCALGLGAIGAAMPLLPTTPFILLAAFAFSRSSDRWRDWLIGHPTFGPLIQDWRANGAISPRAKLVGTLSMGGVLVLSAIMGARPILLGVQALVLLCCAAFILTRPSPPKTRD